MGQLTGALKSVSEMQSCFLAHHNAVKNVGRDLLLQSLEMGILNCVQSLGIENKDQWTVISHVGEVGQLTQRPSGNESWTEPDSFVLGNDPEGGRSRCHRDTRLPFEAQQARLGRKASGQVVRAEIP
ncbi:hypothetical protein SK128_007312 [Halocaridina rubra]|uniref:Uncharacterized protein n=1 Tax=Halocaridina rubra TaxID=373956 RepID=A0AAN8XFJ6_HALRR